MAKQKWRETPKEGAKPQRNKTEQNKTLAGRRVRKIEGELQSNIHAFSLAAEFCFNTQMIIMTFFTLFIKLSYIFMVSENDLKN